MLPNKPLMSERMRRASYRVGVKYRYKEARRTNVQFRIDSDEWVYYWGYADCVCGATLVIQATVRQLVENCHECGKPIEIDLDEVIQ